MTNKKCKCKKLCKYCHHFDKDDETCNENYTTKTECVYGKEYKEYKKAKDCNKNGECTKYSENRNLINKDKLLKALYNYTTGKYHFNEYANVKESLVQDLINVLEGEESRYLDVSYEYDEDYGDIVPTKEFQNKRKTLKR